tara:strand:- start:20378 stop:20584 length:207 start_codon:yes stop_codon:yes gene_type:complete
VKIRVYPWFKYHKNQFCNVQITIIAPKSIDVTRTSTGLTIFPDYGNVMIGLAGNDGNLLESLLYQKWI